MNEEPNCFALPWERRSKRRAMRPSDSLASLWGLCILITLAAAMPSFGQGSGPPIIQIQPSNQTAFAGGSVQFSVTAIGASPLSYQWFKVPTVPLPNGTEAVFNLFGADEPDSGSYFVRVTNLSGRVFSTNVSLVVTRADFGDAPAPYPTLLSADGARHVIMP